MQPRTETAVSIKKKDKKKEPDIRSLIAIVEQAESKQQINEFDELDMPDEWRRSLDRVANLKFGWDSFDGIPVPADILRVTESLLVELHQRNAPLPRLVPGGDGTMQLEYRKTGLDIYVAETGSVEISDSDGTTRIGADYSKFGRYVEQNRHMFQA